MRSRKREVELKHGLRTNLHRRQRSIVPHRGHKVRDESRTAYKQRFGRTNNSEHSQWIHRSHSVRLRPCLRLDMTVKVILLENSPAVLSLGRPCRENNFEFRWPGGIPSPSNGPHLIKSKKVYNLFSQNDVPHITAARKSPKKKSSRPAEKAGEDKPKDKT